jgi:hypothetical protein
VRLNPIAFAAATAISIAIIWTLCSVFVAILPSAMMSMTGHMMHATLEAFSWRLTLAGYLVGLVAWSAWAAVTAWLIAWFYNRLAVSA